MSNTRRTFTPAEKVAILRRHLLEKVPVSSLCDEHGLNPNVFYRWQKEFFENGATAFEPRGDGKTQRLEKEIAGLRARLAHKDEVIAEIMESHVALKRGLGETSTGLGPSRMYATR